MTYNEAIKYLFDSAPMFQNIGAGAYKEGLSNTILLDTHFGNPHRRYKTIHIAGTNGKGSCSHTIAAVLQATKLKVGLYTSPHLVDFRERIRINGEPITEEYVIGFVEKIRADFGERIEKGELSFSFFELATAMAFKYFADKKVDIAVIEVGLGGRLDCTNIISPLLSVITNISFDHTQFLGNTLAKIATEKAGIIKKGTPVVIGETAIDTKPVFEKIAKEKNAPIYFAEEANDIDTNIDYELKGNYQEKNIRTILTAIKVLQHSPEFRIRYPLINENSLKEGLKHVCGLTGLRGRWETLRKEPLVICDTGHNVAGWEYLAPQIASVPCKKRHIVFGCVEDKDVKKILRIIASKIVSTPTKEHDSHCKIQFYFCKPSISRGRDAEEVRQIATEFGIEGLTYPTVKEAYESALINAEKDDYIFVGGSSFVVADLLSLGI